MYIKLFLFIGYLSLSTLCAQSSHTILTYNLLNYEDEDDREPLYQLIIDEIQPDIIICQEVNANEGFNHFLSDVLDVAQPNEWVGAEFTNQSASQDIALYYKPQYFNYISTSVINTAQGSGTRDVIEWVLQHIESSVQFRVYGVHLKASSGTSNAQERLLEATALRSYLDTLPLGSHFIVCGDFNIYSNSSTSEPAFDMLTVAGENISGQLFDPINRIGHWHNNSSFADVHTQSPRTTQFGGGANGGMDDRFDWIFASSAVMEETYEMTYVENTYIVLGNDGAHFNQAINSGTNSAVSQEIADALHGASDHLPVFADFQFPSGDESDYNLVISEVMPNPSAVSDSYGEWFEVFNLDSIPINLNGWTIMDEGSDSHVITSSIELQPGEYMVLGRNSDENVNGGYVSDYTYTSFALANSDDEIILLDQDEKVVDNISYGITFPYSNGVSMYLEDPLMDNDVDTNWTASTISYGDGDFGTPGRAWNDSIVVSIVNNHLTPEIIELYPPYPNPFNPNTKISFSINNRTIVSLNIYDINGRLIQNIYHAKTPAGYYHFIWNADNLSSGIYFLSLEYDKKIKTQKLMLIK